MSRGTLPYSHISGKLVSTGDDDEELYSIDAWIKSWFYSTCDPRLHQIISSDDCTTKDFWVKLDEIFHNKKMSRMLQLQDQFCNTKKGSSSIIEFCHTIKNLSNDLKDIDSTITKIELVMQILHQLPPSYHSIVDVITNMKPLPSFLVAKNMILLHESREVASDATFDLPMS